MKIKEELTRDEFAVGLRIRFSIIGDKVENSVEIPIWEKVTFLSDIELMDRPSEFLGYVKQENALAVFAKYYRDTFLPPTK
jgi:hypothetical protein